MLADEDVDAWLTRSLDDHRLSRNERQTLAGLVGPGVDVAKLKRTAFEKARLEVAKAGPDAAPVLDWLEAVVSVLDRADPVAPPAAVVADAIFSPGDGCWTRIRRLFDEAKDRVDVCVFTITDDRISDAIVHAHRRGVVLRIITDNEKAEDVGSDIDRFCHEGIPLLVDRTESHMHHKFAVFDGGLLLSGSYNWTRGAAHANQENVILTTHPRLVDAFAREFQALWDRLGRPAPN